MVGTRYPGTTVTSTNGVPIVAERPIYFWYEERIAGGDCVMGCIPPNR